MIFSVRNLLAKTYNQSIIYLLSCKLNIDGRNNEKVLWWWFSLYEVVWPEWYYVNGAAPNSPQIGLDVWSTPVAAMN